MSYYLRMGPDIGHQVWNIDDTTAVRLGVTNPERGAGTFYKAAPGETAWQAIERCTPWLLPQSQNTFHKIVLDPGQYYPRMARPTDRALSASQAFNPGIAAEAVVVAMALSQLNTLVRQLDRICQTVHPTEQTFETFGHDIRNLLILACTEVENHWRGVLANNGVSKTRFNTRDYVAIRGAMRLDEYAVGFPSYPWLAPLAPYKGWGSSNHPTEDLKWYDAYNAVKHNREKEFSRATLRHTFEAMTACVIMMVAQFGLASGFSASAELRAFFHFSALPDWSPSDIYVHPYENANAGWSAVEFKFA